MIFKAILTHAVVTDFYPKVNTEQATITTSPCVTEGTDLPRSAPTAKLNILNVGIYRCASTGLPLKFVNSTVLGHVGRVVTNKVQYITHC